MIGFVPLLWLGLLLLLSGSAGTALGLVILGIAIGHLVILNELWNMNTAGLTWAYVFYGTGALLALYSLDIWEGITLLLVLVYLTSVSEKFD